MYINNLITGTMTLGSGGSTPSGHSETRFTLQGGTVETHNITGTLDRQWMIQNGYYDENNYEWTKDITKADIGNTVTYIGDYAFNCSYTLTDVIIPNTVTQLGFSAFGGAENLITLTIPESVRKIDDDAFIGCASM